MKVGIIAAAVTGSCTLLYLLFRLRFNKTKDKSTKMGKNESEPLNLSKSEEIEDHILNLTKEEHEICCNLEATNINSISEFKLQSEDVVLNNILDEVEEKTNISNLSSIESVCSEDVVKESISNELNLSSSVVVQKVIENILEEESSPHNVFEESEVKHLECNERSDCYCPPSSDVLLTDKPYSSNSNITDVPISNKSQFNNASSDSREDLSNVSPVLQQSPPQSVLQLYSKPSIKNDVSSSKSKRLKKREKKNAQKESKFDSDLNSQLKTPSTTSSSSRSPSVSECNSVPEVNGNVWENSKSLVDGVSTSDWERETSPEQENIIDSQSLVSQASLDSGQGSIEVEPETIFTNSSQPHTANNSTDHYIFYQFEIPQLYVGRLIGSKGAFINKVKSSTGTAVVVLDHPNQRLKMCSVEGKKSEVSHALELIRHRFPLDEYHEVTLEQINSPSISPDHQPTINRQVLQVELPCGVVVEVQASAVVSGGELWLQQPLHPSYSALNRLHHCITLNYGDGSTAPGVPTPVQVNTVCVCRFGTNWLRCQVADSDETSCVVTLLDVGGTLRVPASYLKQIRVDYMSLPFQATQCFLHGVMPANGTSWDEASRASLEELTKNTILHATIAAYSQEGIPFVTLYQRSYNQYIFINEKLVEMGHAKWM